MAKLQERKYSTLTGEIKNNGYRLNIPRRIAEAAGIGKDDMLELEAEKGIIHIKRFGESGAE